MDLHWIVRDDVVGAATSQFHDVEGLLQETDEGTQDRA
jgi:hypothetical protein